MSNYHKGLLKEVLRVFKVLQVYNLRYTYEYRLRFGIAKGVRAYGH